MREVRGQNVLKFNFQLHQKLNDFEKKNELDLEKTGDFVMERVTRCVPCFGSRKKDVKADWIPTKIENAVSKRYQLFHEWIQKHIPSVKTKMQKQRTAPTALI